MKQSNPTCKYKWSACSSITYYLLHPAEFIQPATFIRQNEIKSPGVSETRPTYLT